MKNQLILFPCKHDKSPDVKSSWKNFDQSHYDTALARLSSGKGLVGVVVPSGHFLIDIDSYKDECSSLEQIEEKLGCSLPWGAALIQTTKNGGAHYLFRLPENVDGAKLPNTTNLLGLKHVDSRADGGRGYVCSGQGYRAHGVFEQLQTGSFLEGSPVLPEKAIETLLKSGREIIGTTPVEAECGIDEMSLVEWLNALPDSNFVDYTSWIDTLFACHHATGGARWGMEVFDSISRAKGGDAYTGKDDIAKRWNTASRSGAAGAITFASIAAKVKEANPDEFKKLFVERKKAAVISGFDIIEGVDEGVDEADEASEGVSASGYQFSECFKTKRARNSFALSLNSLVCRAQDKDDFTYVNAGEAGGTEKIRDWALRAATEIKSDFEFEACADDVFEMINEFNDLYTGACVFGVVPEFMRRKFLIMEHGGKTTQVLIRNTDSSWARIAPAVFDSRAVHAESFKGFTNKVSRFNPGCPKTWKISPSWVMSDFYRSQKLTGETFEIFKPKIIQFDDDGYNQKLNMFQPWRALTLCRDVKSGADLSGLREEGSMQQAISREYRVRDAWHIFQQFIFQLVGADIGKIGDDGSAVTTEREYWARMLIATMASTVQRPDVRREWALILKGSQGVGKSTTTEIMRRVLGDNVSIDGGVDRIRGWKDFCGLKSGSGSGNSKVVATSLKGVTDRFNTILRGQLVCVIEELDVDEKISTSDELKHVLTSGTINIEAKGIDVIEEKSYLNFYIFSNKVMPMMLGAERRFSVIETALRDDVGADAVNEYMARLSFSHVDGTDFVQSGVVPEFDREKWLDTDLNDGETLSDEGAVAYNEYHLKCAEYKVNYFNKLNSYLIQNDDGIKALGAALALVDIAKYCPEFNLKHGFASTEKNAMQAKSVGEGSISAIDSARLSRFSGKTEELCDWLWGKNVVKGMINGSQLILKNIQAQTLFCDGTGTEMLSHRRAELVNTLRDCLRGDNVMEDKVVDVISSMDDPLLNPYVVDLKQLSQDCLMGVDQHHPRDVSKPGNHLKMIRHILSSLGYTPYIELFKRNGGAKRGVLATTMKGGTLIQKWLTVDSLYVFKGKVDGQQVNLGARDYKLVRLIFGAVNKPGI